MGLLSSILLAPFTGPFDATMWTLEKVRRVVEDELTDDTPVKEELFRLQLLLDAGEIAIMDAIEFDQHRIVVERDAAGDAHAAASRAPVTISPAASLEDLVELMTSRKIKRVPVIENGKLVGIVARSDLMRAMLRALPASAPVASDDERIRQAIIGELAKRTWSSAIRVTVDHGVAELDGAIFDERARQAARVAAENIPGVTKVVDQLSWIEPMSGMYILPPPTQET